MILLATLLEFVYVVSILDVMPVTFMMGVAVIVNILPFGSCCLPVR